MQEELVPTASAHPMLFRAPSERPAPSPISQLLFVIFKWRRLILGMMLAFTIAAVVLALLKPPVRTAAAKILYKPDRAALQISGLSAAAARLPYSPQALQSEVELLRSRSVLLPVATALMSDQNPSPEALEGKTNALRGNLVATTIPDTNMIQMTYSGRSAADAERALGLIVKHYMEQHAAAFRDSPAVNAFYEKETTRAAADLRKAEDALTKWQEANRTVAIDPEITAQLDKLAALEKNLNQAEADIQGTQAKLAALERLVKSQPERAVMMREQMPNPLIAKLQADVIVAEVALEDLRRRYTDRDRTVIEKKEQIAMLRKELATAQVEANVPGREATGPNPLRESLERDLVAARAQSTSLASMRDTLRQQSRDTAAALAPLRDKKVGIERLMRDVTIARESFLTHSRRLEESRIAAGLDRQHLSDIAVVEHPYVTPDSDLMRRILIVALACVVGVALGVASAFTIEFFNNSVRTPEDVEFYVGLPVVATIPMLPASAASLVAPPLAALESGAKSDRA